MKKIILFLGLLLSLCCGCSWLHHGDADGSGSRSEGSISGPDYNPGRGTTGVSSGAASGQGITGSDAAPPQ
jgi:hypothetical protein